MDGDGDCERKRVPLCSLIVSLSLPDIDCTERVDEKLIVAEGCNSLVVLDGVGAENLAVFAVFGRLVRAFLLFNIEHVLVVSLGGNSSGNHKERQDTDAAKSHGPGEVEGHDHGG